jgi:hypothetical protein
VAKGLFPNDTVQSRLPDPEWLTRWLDTQLRFDAACEERVVGAILRNLSVLLGERFETLRDLNRYRRALVAAPPEPGHAPGSGPASLAG